jgi:TRAP-type C4-dicarboxylate transport system permease small subunit
MIKKILAAPIQNPILSPSEGIYDEVAVNPLGPFIARLWWTIVTLGALALLLFLIWGGVDLLTSEGDKEKYTNARNKMTHALMGMAILAASFAIVSILDAVFKVDILNLAWPEP